MAGVMGRNGKNYCANRMLVMARSSKIIGSFALGLLTTLPSIAIRIQAQTGTHGKPIISAYRRSDEGPGKMRLLPGYVAGLPEGQTCIDTECGHIWNPRGLTVDYDIGGLAGVELGPEPPERMAEYFFWYGEASINGQIVRYAVSGGDKPTSLSVSFPCRTRISTLTYAMKARFRRSCRWS